MSGRMAQPTAISQQYQSATAFIYLVLRAIYRITFHPLVRFPGPRLRAISHLPHAFCGLVGRQPYDVRELHSKYGPVVRICPNHLSFITSSSWEDIHGHAATKKLQKYGYFRVRPDAQAMLTTTGDEHARQRAAFAHGFSQRAINDQEPTLTLHVNRLVEKLEQQIKHTSTFDVGEWMRFLAFDIIGDFTLNTQFECVENQRYHPWVTLLMKWFRASSFVTNANAFGQLAPFIMLFAPVAHLKGVKDHLDMSAQKVHERLAIGDDPKRNDLWTYLLRSKGDKALSLGEMEVNAALFLIAATEPLSDVLCGTLYFLALYPDIRTKLRTELEACIGPDGVLNMAVTARSPYLLAVINEFMRMYPPIPGGMRRKTPNEGHIISGIDVPPNTVVTIYQLPAYTLSTNFALHDRFLPERWLPADHPERPKETLADRQEILQPFSIGPKNCIGKGLAYAELKLILARFVYHFDFETVDDGFAIDKQTAYLFRDRPPLRLNVSVRI
ncbi:cytochrome P450 [Lophiostoma macrostomum CBS 122681]|uniref:Cytochrome P450 n=1 Tax=Lophiostoma macrostomum CBS 122681 TaxID=1314788 RepID=A0A6A6TAI3_9PLEO|nr:cytochrome P450 [Lophiostoma macrostomum CBS 122681]